ncbi:NAD(P)-dependent alcohol dehydrogenase [Streptomyces sp. NBC_00249]|uniref:zinc-dependent alcohol dehydrogenase family protein n=1 Tax=Streptomyces sp. NBC_00249 TaxID=2975690 RepID=UPI00225295AC|nr:NAD(P)-dependent alcohol dehydrogenase [Streptomyces sp. NBC_00249]MCX5196673.1 NAD(P)-dependent alcohol dehydrogenase [Streptomyces sp. NBC_00249]
MRSYHLRPGAGIDGLSLREHDVPEPGPGQVLLRVRAAALSLRELLVLDGTYPLPVRPDVVPGCAGVGEVVAVGPGVTRVTAGDRVAASVFPDWLDGPFSLDNAAQLGSSLDGVLTEYALAGERGLVPLPGHLSFEEAAALPLTGVTAWNAVTGGRPPSAGETVLTLGSGGVSLFAVRFAALAGARVIATTRTPGKAERLRALGAHEVVVTGDDPDWGAQVRRRTGGRGVDRVVDVVGNLPQSLAAVAPGGEIAFVGHSLGAAAPSAAALFGAGAVLRPLAVGSRAQFEAMNRAVEGAGLRPPVHRVFPFEEVPQALRYYRAGGFVGNVVVAQP